VQGVGEIERQIAAEKFILHGEYCNWCLPLTGAGCNHYCIV
jgi:hypothetical protein